MSSSDPVMGDSRIVEHCMERVAIIWDVEICSLGEGRVCAKGGVQGGTSLKVLLRESPSGWLGVCTGGFTGESVNHGTSVIEGWLMGISIQDVLLGSLSQGTLGVPVSGDAKGGHSVRVSGASRIASPPSAPRETSSRRATWKTGVPHCQ